MVYIKVPNLKPNHCLLRVWYGQSHTEQVTFDTAYILYFTEGVVSMDAGTTKQRTHQVAEIQMDKNYPLAEQVEPAWR